MLLLLAILLLGLPQLEAGALHAPAIYRPTVLASATLHVIERYISPRLNTLVIVEVHGAHDKGQPQDQLLSHVLQHRPRHLALQLSRDIVTDLNLAYYVFIVSSMEAFRSLHLNFYVPQFEREFYMLIVITWDLPMSRRESNLYDIFITCLKLHVLNAVVMFEQQQQVLFYGYKLFGEKCNRTITLHRINVYEQEQLQQNWLFPPQQLNLFGCSLKVSWYALPPFVYFNGDERNRSQLAQSQRLTGIDGELLKLLAGVFNFELQLLPGCRKSIVDAHGNATGCFANLQTGEASIAIGALSGSYLQRHLFSTTCPYYQSPLVFVVRADRSYGTMGHLLAPFERRVWHYVLASCALALLLRCLQRRSIAELAAGLLHVVCTLLGNPISVAQLPRQRRVQLFFFGWLLLALVLRGVYQGKLFDVFRAPCYAPLPRNVADLLQQNYTLLSAEPTEFFPANRTQIMRSSFMQRFGELQRDRHPRRVTTALLGNLAHYNQLNWETSRLTYIKEPIYMYHLVMYLTKNSLLKFAFDRKIRQFMSSGIVSYFSRNFEIRKFRYLKIHDHADGIQLQLLAGLYRICILMLLVSLIIFALELLSLRLRWLRYFFE